MVSENNLASEGHLEAKIFYENMKLNWNFVGLSSGKGLKTGEGTEYRYFFPNQYIIAIGPHSFPLCLFALFSVQGISLISGYKFNELNTSITVNVLSKEFLDCMG